MQEIRRVENINSIRSIHFAWIVIDLAVVMGKWRISSLVLHILEHLNIGKPAQKCGAFSNFVTRSRFAMNIAIGNH
jgi:hypothetical protein